jgi:hypothetical protein
MVQPGTRRCLLWNGVSEQIDSLAGITVSPTSDRMNEVNTKYWISRLLKLQLDRHANARTVDRPTGVKNGEMYIRNAVLLTLNIHSLFWRRPCCYSNKERKGK